MRKYLLFTTVLASFVFNACNKESDIERSLSAKKLSDVKVPEGFTWESSRNVTFKVNITDNSFGNLLSVVAIYGPDSKLIAKGSAGVGKSFETTAYLPNTVTEAYIIRTAPDNSNTTEKVTLNKAEVNVSFAQSAVTVSSAKSSNKVLATSPNCTSGCTQSVSLSSNNQTVTISGGKTVCVSGSNKTLDVSFTNGGGTLRLCGTNLTIADLDDNKINDPMKIVVTDGSIVTFDDKNNKATNFNQNNNTLENYGTITFDGGINLAGVLTNNGIINVIGEYSTETQTSPQTVHTNNGTITVNGLMDVGSNSLFYNNGSIKTTDFRVFNHATFFNYCKLWVTNEYDHSTTMKNYGYIRVDSKTFINGTSELGQYNGAQLTTKDIKINGTIKGYNNTSLVKVTNETELTGAGTITGALQYCDANGLEKNLGTINGGATLACGLLIPISSCNPEGNGTPVIMDTDGDGVPDALDDYPTDASKAFINYAILGGADAGATVTFEDMWPIKGDYDLNDVVMSYQLKIISNASNAVVQVDGNYMLTARGGIFHNGFGIEFPINRTAVSNVTGATLEAGQSKAVIILFNDMHNEMYYMNTRLEDPKSPSVSYSFSFQVNDGTKLSDFGLSEYNPFIWSQDAGRGAEVHLPGKKPTSLANLTLFGTGDDKSSPAQNKYYVTAEGYPWAISVPIKSFTYPIEGKDIITAYLKLPEWITSGGTKYKDWYSNTAGDYRNKENLFVP
ncbi:LruC domain-containing protein [Desertivirga brevis]|uniref:LruC domain-containing protein n=1 Tax=Desertivirga brevis TaxID=2810310 RepID=UPI001A96CE4A|nr:LruC domain-containing protein [Pedobacter sp. SYSU D00873]